MRNPPLRMQHGTMLGMHEPVWLGSGRGVKRTTVGVLTLVCLECLGGKLSLKYPLNGFLVFVASLPRFYLVLIDLSLLAKLLWGVRSFLSLLAGWFYVTLEIIRLQM